MSLNYRHCLSLLVILLICCQCFAFHPRMQSTDFNQANPHAQCYPKNNTEDIKRFCKHGGYIVNPNPSECGDRYYCYVGLDETCNPGDRCAYDATCTMCGICQKCESSEKCSEFQLCPNFRGRNLFVQSMKKRLLEIDSE